MAILPRRSKKRITYIELIFDLMFVYLIRLNDELLEPEGSFFSPSAYMVYLISTLVILQIWSYSTLYMNRFGRGEIADYVLLFTNLYLLYYIGLDTTADWIGRYALYHVSWALILLCFLLRFVWMLIRPAGRNGASVQFLRSRVISFGVQAAVVLLTIPWSADVQRVAAWAPLLVGFAAPLFTRKVDAQMPLNFPHLAERVECMVLISFGEVILSIAGFFDDNIGLHEVYFSLCAFLVVVGLLLSYGYMYVHMIDREHCKRGALFLFLHVFFIIALNNITVSFRITLDPTASRWDNQLFAVISMLAFYVMLCLITRVGGRPGAQDVLFPPSGVLISAIFAAVMMIWHMNTWVTAAATVVYSFAMLACFIRHWHPKTPAGDEPNEELDDGMEPAE